MKIKSQHPQYIAQLTETIRLADVKAKRKEMEQLVYKSSLQMVNINLFMEILVCNIV